jgi:hypothetical protein
LSFIASGLAVTQVELLDLLETLPDSTGVTWQNSRSCEPLDELLDETLDAMRAGASGDRWAMNDAVTDEGKGTDK